MFPLGLVLAISLSSVRILSGEPPAPSPSPPPSSSPVDFSFPGPAPSRAPDVPRDPPFPVPPPQAEQQVPLPTPPPALAFRSQPPSAAEIARVTPQVEIWRAGGVVPQRPARHGHRVETAYVLDDNPVLVRLQFDLLAAGKTVAITGANRIAVNPPQAVFPVRTTGECIVSLQLDESATRGHITFSCEGQATTLSLARALPELVAAKEKPRAEGTP
jgi:hypothetical protein